MTIGGEKQLIIHTIRLIINNDINFAAHQCLIQHDFKRKIGGRLPVRSLEVRQFFALRSTLPMTKCSAAVFSGIGNYFFL